MKTRKHRIVKNKTRKFFYNPNNADEDDCGNGGNAESLKTGNAGKRIACAVIGYSKENF